MLDVPASPGSSVVRDEGEGDALHFLGGLYEVKVAGEDTGDAVTVMQMTLPERMGPPLHAHASGETVYVVEGKARFHVDGETREVGPGSVFHFPAGTKETFEPIGQVKVLITYSPGGVDRFFQEVGEPAPGRDIPPPPQGPPDLEAIAPTGAKYGLELLGPPPGA